MKKIIFLLISINSKFSVEDINTQQDNAFQDNKNPIILGFCFTTGIIIILVLIIFFFKNIMEFFKKKSNLSPDKNTESNPILNQESLIVNHQQLQTSQISQLNLSPDKNTESNPILNQESLIVNHQQLQTSQISQLNLSPNENTTQLNLSPNENTQLNLSHDEKAGSHPILNQENHQQYTIDIGQNHEKPSIINKKNLQSDSFVFDLDNIYSIINDDLKNNIRNNFNTIIVNLTHSVKLSGTIPMEIRFDNKSKRIGIIFNKIEFFTNQDNTSESEKKLYIKLFNDNNDYIIFQRNIGNTMINGNSIIISNSLKESFHILNNDANYDSLLQFSNILNKIYFNFQKIINELISKTINQTNDNNQYDDIIKYFNIHRLIDTNIMSNLMNLNNDLSTFYKKNNGSNI